VELNSLYVDKLSLSVLNFISFASHTSEDFLELGAKSNPADAFCGCDAISSSSISNTRTCGETRYGRSSELERNSPRSVSRVC